MKASKQVPIFLLIFLTGCAVVPMRTPVPSPAEIRESATPTNTLEIKRSTPTSTPTPTPPVILPSVTYRLIDSDNISEIEYIRSWDIYGVNTPPYTWSDASIWFTSSDQFALPIYKDGNYGIQSYKVEGYSGNWFVEYEVYILLDIEEDEVFTYQNGLLVLDKEGSEIQRIPDDGNCSGHTDPLMLAISGTDQVVTGFSFYNKFTDMFDESLIVLWDRNQETCTKLIGNISGWLWSMTIDEGNRYLTYSIVNNYVDPNDGEYKKIWTTHLFDMSLGEELCFIDNGGDVLYSPQNHLLIHNIIDGSIEFIEPTDCSKIRRLDINTVFSSFTIDPSGKLIFGATKNSLQIRDTNDGKLIRKITLDPYPNNPIQKVSISPDGKFLVWARDRTSPTKNGQIVLFGIVDKK